mmetsp:Transcript_106275/g.307769  ORF Transcript_106275/g.307769 Transcript_106275/m.307769 type:complete len:269 (-) Transcript_106275:1390-2196(-)
MVARKVLDQRLEGDHLVSGQRLHFTPEVAAHHLEDAARLVRTHAVELPLPVCNLVHLLLEALDGVDLATVHLEVPLEVVLVDRAHLIELDDVLGGLGEVGVDLFVDRLADTTEMHRRAHDLVNVGRIAHALHMLCERAKEKHTRHVRYRADHGLGHDTDHRLNGRAVGCEDRALLRELDRRLEETLLARFVELFFEIFHRVDNELHQRLDGHVVCEPDEVGEHVGLLLGAAEHLTTVGLLLLKRDHGHVFLFSHRCEGKVEWRLSVVG